MSDTNEIFVEHFPSPPVTTEYDAAARDSNSDIFFAAVETTRMPMIVTDPKTPDNHIIFANRAFLQMTGYSREEIVGTNCRFLQGPDTDKSVVDEIREAIRERRDYATEILNYRKNGSSFWNALFISPVYDSSGELVYFFGSQLDVSRRRDAEEALGQAQKMEALGQLTGGIAHDFNNLLQVMAGYLDVMEMDLESPEPDVHRMARSIKNVRSAAGKATVLTQQLLAFARKQRLEGRIVNMNSLCDNLADLVRRTLGGTIELKTQLEENLWNCRVDPTQMEIALLNILINARDAMPQGGTVIVTTKNEVLSTEDSTAYSGLPLGNYVSISVTDTGEGIHPSVISRVMDPFFTTKDEGKGTGLGLSMVYGFAKQSGGIAQIYSELNIGTTLRLFFPATEETVRSSPVVKAQEEIRGSESILVVDDRPEVAELAEVMLNSMGYKVTVVLSTADALQVIKSDEKIDLLFSDLIMPGNMNGVVLAKEARKYRPDIKVLLTTGYAAESIERVDQGGAEFDIISKPYRRVELARKMRQVLRGFTGVG